jgi:hypothetical protein
MKRSTLYLLIITIIAALLGWGLFKAYRAFKVSMEPTVCICTVSPEASDQAAQALIKCIEQAILEKKGSLASATQAVQKEFPYCTSMSCHQQPSGMVQARIELDEPFCAVNDDMVMTKRGVVVSRLLYADEVLAGLPQLRIADQKDSSASPYLLSFLKHIPDSLLSTHEVVYRSDDEIALVRREITASEPLKYEIAQNAMAQRDALKSDVSKRTMSKSSVAPSVASQAIYLCAVDTIVDQELLTRCDNVIADFEQQKILKKRSKTAVVLDLRFDKQVILYPHMGGQIHG